MHHARTSTRPGRTRWAHYLAAAALLLSAILPAACEPAPNVASAPRPEARPLDTDPAVAERVGRAALEKLGYEKILRLALEKGWIWYPPPRSGNALGQVAAAVPLFTQYAVAAGVASQADSPAPGPADALALGILVVGLVHAGLVAAHVVSAPVDAPIIGPTAAPPVPLAAPMSRPAPTVIPTTTTMPIATATPTWKWSEFPECELQYEQDTAYCNRFRKAKDQAICHAVASDRLAHCDKTRGETGIPLRWKP